MQNIKTVIENGDLSVMYQPIINIRTGEIYAYEAYIRGPKGTSIESPMELFEAAKVTGLSNELNTAAIKVIINNYESNKKLFININADNFTGIEDAERLRDYAKRNNILCSDIVLEITETSQTDTTRFIETLEAFKEKGFGISYDSIMTGFSNINRIIKVKPDYIKTKRDLIYAAMINPFARKMTDSLIEYCNTNDVIIIASGIDDEQAIEVLSELQIEIGQGFGLAMLEDKPNNIIEEEQKKRITGISKKHFEGTALLKEVISRDYKTSKYAKVREVKKFFEENPSDKIMPIVSQKNVPQGILTRKYVAELDESSLDDECVEHIKLNALVLDENTNVLKAASYAILRFGAEEVMDVVVYDKYTKEYKGLAKNIDIIKALNFKSK